MSTSPVNLLYADDLLIVSESKSGLQHSLDKLHNYCKNWKLDLNIKKTKIVIFSKSLQKEQTQFMFGDKHLQIADTCSYLGIKLTAKTSFSEAIKLLKEKASKATFLLNSSLYTGITFQPDLPLKVFDNTIRPILTYGCEIWCIEYIKSLSKLHKIDKAPFEMVNNHFCKRIMGLPRKVSNFGVKAELGRNPLSVCKL